MSAEQLRELNRIIRNGWKNLALADQSEAEQLLEVVKGILADLETIEKAE